MTKKEKSNLEELKKNYQVIQKKYNLPDFARLNEDFQIEKVSELETDNLIREIRKFMADKFSSYLRFVETILHPVNAPMFVFSVVKLIGNDEKDRLNEVYKKLVKIEIRLIDLDIEFNEKKEAEFVKDSYELWQNIKKDILQVLDTIKKNWNNKTESNNKDYFG